MPNSTWELQGPNARIHVVRSRLFNIDNGAGTTVDDCILRHSQQVTLTAARIVYTTETAGTVAGANVKVGTTVGGVDVVAATAYTNTSTIGSKTALTLVGGPTQTILADTPVIVRHTGIAATATGEAYVEIEYAVDD
jgi:phosphotransacetylase